MEKLLAHSTEILRRRKLLCFRNFLISRSFTDEKGGREYHDFSSKICYLTVPKSFVGEPLCVSENFCYRNFQWISGRLSLFSAKSSLAQVRKHSVEGPFCVSESLWCHYMLGTTEAGGNHHPLSKNYCLTAPKFFVGDHVCASEKIWYQKHWWIRRRGTIKVSCRKLVVSKYRKSS